MLKVKTNKQIRIEGYNMESKESLLKEKYGWEMGKGELFVLYKYLYCLKYFLTMNLNWFCILQWAW